MRFLIHMYYLSPYRRRNLTLYVCIGMRIYYNIIQKILFFINDTNYNQLTLDYNI